MKLIRELTESVQYLTEEKDGKKTLFIEGPFLVAEAVNKNKRMYKDKKKHGNMSPCFTCVLIKVLYEFYNHGRCTTASVANSSRTALCSVLFEYME